MINWHRIFGLSLRDYFTDKPYEVELEKDLSMKQQFLDITIVRKKDQGIPGKKNTWCSGLQFLKKYNLLTFKSHQEVLNVFAFLELIGHYINYCKSMGKDGTIIEDVQLFAISAHYPRKVFSTTEVETIEHGVYRIRLLEIPIIVIVTSRIHKSEANALWNLYSFKKESALYGFDHYRWQNRNHSSVISKLYEHFEKEGWYMPYTIEQFKRDLLEEDYTVEERLEGIPDELLLERIPPEKRLEGIPIEKRLEGLSREEIDTLLSKYIKK